MTIWGPQMTPKLTENRLKLAPGAPWAPPEPNLVLILTPKVHFGAHFGSPGGPKIDQKSQLALKILIWKLFFFCVFYSSCFEELFASFMCRLWLKFAQNFNEKRACVIQSFALFAQPGTPSKPSFLLGKTMVFEEFVFLH